MKFYSSALLFLGSLLSVTGCTTAQVVTGPDGSAHISVRCGYINHCYEQAREACGGNYKIDNTSNSVDGNDGKTDTTHDLLVKCEGEKTGNL